MYVMHDNEAADDSSEDISRSGVCAGVSVKCECKWTNY